MSELRTSEAAELIGMTPRGMREIDERYHVTRSRTDGGHRRWDRHLVLGLRDAYAEGVAGRAAVERARELAASGRYRDPELYERLARLEATVEATNRMLQRVAARLGV